MEFPEGVNGSGIGHIAILWCKACDIGAREPDCWGCGVEYKHYYSNRYVYELHPSWKKVLLFRKNVHEAGASTQTTEAEG